MTESKKWQRPSQEKIKSILSKEQFRVTQKNGTEKPFQNEYWDNEREGIYVDIVSGEPLFCSKDKYKSGTGWPSFMSPLDSQYIVEKPDNSLFSRRTEVRSKVGDSHLGHVFNDGPKPTGLRYCVNSAALRFIPVNELEKEGYGEYMSLFSSEPEKESTNSVQRATFAGGCFWCMEPPYDQLAGVMKTIPGYAGGKTKNPTYEEVCSGSTGHLEVMQIIFDPTKTSYEELLEVFWHNVDPTDDGGQFVDRGYQYSTAIFYHDQTQKNLAEESKKKLDESGIFKKKIVTEIRKLEDFFSAEDYHQDFYKKNPLRYKSYRQASGRDDFLKSVWDDQKKKK